MTEISSTQVIEDARLELLRCLAAWRDFVVDKRAAGGTDYGEWIPLFGASDWKHPSEDILIAVREAEAMGHVKRLRFDQTKPAERILQMVHHSTVAITDEGYDWIRAHDSANPAVPEVTG